MLISLWRYKRCLKGQGEVKMCEEQGARFKNTKFFRECGGIQNCETSWKTSLRSVNSLNGQFLAPPLATERYT